VQDDGGDGDDHATQEQGRREQHLLPSIERISLNNKKDKKDGTQHTFWDTQPMPHERLKSSGEDHGPIEGDKPKSALRQTPYNMPKGFAWADLDIMDEKERAEVYELLTCNYVEDDECMFRFDYSAEFLIWALTPPGYRKEFHLGVRSSKSGRLMAFITAIPATVRVYHKEVQMVEINFLCIHKKLRSKRLAPVLIKEITRRVNHTGVFQAVYTAGVVLPVPVASCRYYHRSLDPKKLIEVEFSRLPPRMTMARMQRLFRLPEQTALTSLRPMTPDDVSSAHKLLSKYLQKFNLSVIFSEEEFAHWLLPREGVIQSYVNTDPKTNEVTDFISFYHLPSSIMQNPKHTHLNAAYSFYNVATTVELTDLMKDALILAKRCKQDVFNALNLMENDLFLNELKFGIGDGNLQYYLYNWRCPEMHSKDVGIVFL